MLEPMTAADESTVTAQLQRPARGVVGVAYRCPCGKPAVVVTQPRLADGTPFPDDVLPHLPAGSCSVLLAGVAGPDGRDESTAEQ